MIANTLRSEPLATAPQLETIWLPDWRRHKTDEPDDLDGWEMPPEREEQTQLIHEADCAFEECLDGADEIEAIPDLACAQSPNSAPPITAEVAEKTISLKHAAKRAPEPVPVELFRAEPTLREAEIVAEGLRPVATTTIQDNGHEESGTEQRAQRKIKVLAIDDDAVMRKLLKMGLTPHGYECETAENGKVAQDLLKTYRPELILVDLLMPVMDGLSFINWLRQTARNTTPVLVFTNLSGTEITQEALRSGANSIASKPLHFKELLQAMKQLVPA